MDDTESRVTTRRPRDPAPSPSERIRASHAVEAVARALGEDAPPADGVFPLAKLESLYTRAVVTLCGGSKVLAAKALGVDRRSVYRLLEREAG